MAIKRKYESLISALTLATVMLRSFGMVLRTMWNPDEGRYAEIGSSILVFDDRVTTKISACSCVKYCKTS
jgi:hypothetical protein